jgi:hypothetical protein
MTSIEAWLQQNRQHDNSDGNDTRPEVDSAPTLYRYLKRHTSAKDRVATACAASAIAANNKKGLQSPH